MNNKLLQEIYGFSFPQSFFEFQDFIEEVPEKILLSTLGIELEGPFLINDDNVTAPSWRSRYYNDPPEFLMVLSGNIDGLHWGYYIDDPNNLNYLPVAYYWSNDAFELSIAGDNLFEAVRDHLERDYNTCLEYMDDEPDEADHYQTEIEKLAIVRTILQKYATQDRNEIGEKYYRKYHAGKLRKIIAKTHDNMGIVLPKELYKSLGKDKFQQEGYQPERTEIDQLIDKAEKLLKRGYPGAALKLSKDLWVEPEFFADSYRLLEMAYQALGRDLLIKNLHHAIAFRAQCDQERLLRNKK